MNFHVINRTNKDTIINNIPWNRGAFSNRFQTGDWNNNRDIGDHTPLTWIYRVTGVSPNLVQAKEYRRVSPNGLIRVENPQEVTLCPESYHLIRVLIQEKHGAPFKVARELPSPPKPPILWIFEIGFIGNLPWDSREWH
jgi:hypothetical protein